MFNLKKYLFHISIFHLSLILAILFWFFETMLHILFFYNDKTSLLDELLPNDINELWMRLFISVLIILAGYFVEKKYQHAKKLNIEINNILNSTTDSYIAIDKNKRVSYINNQALKLFSISKDEIYKHNFWDILPEMCSNFFQPINAMKQNMVVTCKGYYSPANLWLEVHGYPNNKGIVLFIRNITQEMYLDNKKQQLQSIVNNIADGIITINKFGIIQSFNTAAEKIFGFESKEIMNKNISILMTKDHSTHHNRYIKDYIQTGHQRNIGRGSIETRASRKDGTVINIDLAINEAYINDELIFIGIVRNIDERKAIEKKLIHSSNHDPLTNLPNRSLLFDRFQHAINTAKRSKNKIAVIYLDIDNFKTINDTYGHSIGDSILKAFAEMLVKLTRSSDTVARIGGDEFIILLEELKINSDAILFTNKILKNIKAPLLSDLEEIIVGSSIGISLYPQDGIDEDTLLKNADSAMYHAKASGRNKVHLFSDIKTGVKKP